MTDSWGDLLGDRRSLSPEQSVQEHDLGPDVSDWQEEIDYSVVADSSMTLPGKGSPSADCGEWAPRQYCDECGEVHFGPSRCERRSCPDCKGEWTRQRAVGITTRLSEARYAHEDGLGRRVVHSVVSAPEGSIRTLQDVHSGYSDAYEVARAHGVRGGVAIFHGYRVLEEVKALFRADDFDGGLWRYIEEELPGSWRDATYWSPHWHVIGLCRDFAADRPDEQDGWVCRRIRTLTPMKRLSQVDPYDDLVGLVRYIMSHATFEADSSRDCVRWFGELATSKFQAEQHLSDGAIATIERLAEEAAGSGPVADDDFAESAEDDPCPDCGSTSRSPIWEAGSSLADPTWCADIERRKERRLTAAFEWRIGERQPPPGLKRPSTEDDAREALDSLL